MSPIPSIPGIPGRARLAAALLVVGLAGSGCSTVGSTAVRTDGLPARMHVGGVRVYATTPPAGARTVGQVEVHAEGDEANVEVLLPLFLRKVADLGGTGAVIDQVVSQFDVRTGVRTESYAFPCGMRHTCWGTRLVPYTYIVRLLRIEGRAVVPEASP